MQKYARYVSKTFHLYEGMMTERLLHRYAPYLRLNILNIDQLISNGINNQPGSGMNLELLGNVATVGSYRMDRKKKSISNLLIRHILFFCYRI